MELKDKNICNIISSGSTGNCDVYFNSIALDMGIPFSLIKPSVKQLQIVLLTHLHLDHFNIKTIKTLAFERPSLRFAIGKHMIEQMKGIKNVDVCNIGCWYDYGIFKISPVKLYHDVANVGWRVFIKQQNGEYYKIFRATDTAHLEGITAKDYDLYAIEHNYNAETMQERIDYKTENGLFSYEKGSMNSHLSEQHARDFIYNNKKETSKFIRLHQSSNNY